MTSRALWRVIPEAQKAAFANYPKQSTTFEKWRRYVSWRVWNGKEYGLQYFDQAFEPKPEVKEALRRLNIKEPWIWDERQERIIKSQQLASRNEFLPKNQWTKWEEETFYLYPYLAEIEEEQMARSRFNELKPMWKQLLKQEREHLYHLKH